MSERRNVTHRKLVEGRFEASAAISMSSPHFWDFDQRGMVVPYRRFRTTYRSYLETTVGNYHSTLRKIPEGLRSLGGREKF